VDHAFRPVSCQQVQSGLNLCRMLLATKSTAIECYICLPSIIRRVPLYGARLNAHEVTHGHVARMLQLEQACVVVAVVVICDVPTIEGDCCWIVSIRAAVCDVQQSIATARLLVRKRVVQSPNGDVAASAARFGIQSEYGRRRISKCVCRQEFPTARVVENLAEPAGIGLFFASASRWGAGR